MARPFKATTTKGYNSSAKFFLLKNRVSSTGKYQLKIRLTIHSKPSITVDAPVLFPDIIKLAEHEFDKNSNTVIGGFENGHLREIKEFLAKLSNEAVLIGDEIFKQGKGFNDTLFKGLLYHNKQRVERVLVPAYSNEKYTSLEGLNLVPKLSTDTVEWFEKEHNNNMNSVMTFIREQNMPTPDVYKNDAFDKNNIFEVFGRCYYPDFATGKTFVTKGYEDVIFKLFTYKEKMNAPEKIDQFSVKWCYDFLKWNFEKGSLKSTPKKFDPLKYDPAIFEKELVAPDEKTGTGNRKKILKHFKGCVNALIDHKLLPEISLKKLVLEDLIPAGTKVTKETTKQKFALKKNELDYLFHYKFEDKELSQARDIFILQTMFGGLRIGEYTTDNIKVIEDIKNDFIVSYLRQKTGNKAIRIENPFNSYTRIIYNRCKDTLPMILKDETFDRDIYNERLKQIAETIGLNRSIIYEKDQQHYKLKEIFTSLFARHTMYQLFADSGMDDMKINLFTGHSEGNGAHLNYRERNTIENKRKWLKEHKIIPASVPAEIKGDNNKLRKFFKII